MGDARRPPRRWPRRRCCRCAGSARIPLDSAAARHPARGRPGASGAYVASPAGPRGRRPAGRAAARRRLRRPRRRPVARRGAAAARRRGARRALARCAAAAAGHRRRPRRAHRSSPASAAGSVGCPRPWPRRSGADGADRVRRSVASSGSRPAGGSSSARPGPVDHRGRRGRARRAGGPAAGCSTRAPAAQPTSWPRSTTPSVAIVTLPSAVGRSRTSRRHRLPRPARRRAARSRPRRSPRRSGRGSGPSARRARPAGLGRPARRGAGAAAATTPTWSARSSADWPTPSAGRRASARRRRWCTRWGGGAAAVRVGPPRPGGAGSAPSVRPTPGLAVCGAAYDGVGVPACIASGEAAADQVLRQLVLGENGAMDSAPRHPVRARRRRSLSAQRPRDQRRRSATRCGRCSGCDRPLGAPTGPPLAAEVERAGRPARREGRGGPRARTTSPGCAPTPTAWSGGTRRAADACRTRTTGSAAPRSAPPATPVWSQMALHRPAEFNKSHVPAFLADEEPRALRLRLPVRPLLRVVPARRRRARARCSPSTARWRATTRTCGPTRWRRFALGDYEWMLAFEADELHRIVDLMRHLRGSDGPPARPRGGAVLHRAPPVGRPTSSRPCRSGPRRHRDPRRREPSQHRAGVGRVRAPDRPRRRSRLRLQPAGDRGRRAPRRGPRPPAGRARTGPRPRRPGPRRSDGGRPGAGRRQRPDAAGRTTGRSARTARRSAPSSPATTVSRTRRSSRT